MVPIRSLYFLILTCLQPSFYALYVNPSISVAAVYDRRSQEDRLGERRYNN